MARLTVAEFEEAITKATEVVLPKAKGVHGFKVNRCIESPERYVLQIFWEIRRPDDANAKSRL